MGVLGVLGYLLGVCVPGIWSIVLLLCVVWIVYNYDHVPRYRIDRSFRSPSDVSLDSIHYSPLAIVEVDTLKSSEDLQLKWLNLWIAKMWKELSISIGEKFKSSIQGVLERKQPKLLPTLSVISVCLGDTPFTISNLQTLTSQQEEFIIDVDVELRGNPSVIISLGNVHIKVLDFYFKGRVRLIFSTFSPRLPCFQTISFSILKPPILEFKLTTLNVKLENFMGVESTLSTFIRQKLVQSYTWPQQKVVVIGKGDLSDEGVG